MPTCQNCQLEFVTSEDDLAYYNKLQVPPPKWCPSCREMRRMAWCNEMYLYPNTCKLCGKKIVAQFGSSNPRPAYCIQCWWSDKWDPLAYGRVIDWTKPFLEQFHELELTIPHCCVSIDTSAVNSEYTHYAGQEKNCYMIFHATFAEDCYYGYGIKKAKDCIDVHYCHQSNFCYECIDIKDCYNLAWSQDCSNCGSSYFLRDCINCVDCFMCTGLRNKNHCFLNEQLTKDEYKKRLSEINLGSHQQLQKHLAQFSDLQLKHTYRYLQNNMIENSLGDHLYNAKDSFYCFDTSDIEKSKYCSQMQLGVRYCYDIYQYGINSELCYEGAMVGTNAYNIQFCYLCLWQVTNLTYCAESYSSRDCFGCFGLNHNQYCILNKQYAEQEYFNLKEKLIAKMKKDGEFGEFLPIQYSQSTYNETTAQLWYPMTKEQVLAKGWRWQDSLPGTYGKGTIGELPDDIKNTHNDTTKEILTCENCQKNYKIIEQELKFYKKHGYPLPRKCFECRRISRMQKRNPRKFWIRQCTKCQEKFYTTYSPDRPEIIYCEKCYQKKTY
ncbi:MAG: hypothetical protein UV80_C0010G0027 [Candidatus Peregrinibacteria bacterium GW2011_GWF2_43_17]|nr:MAG: hypothetical protein UV80_C0010G0027 [Candidatus Peregrinibacteria bacterium GW2011_GWF2_43_17]